MTATARPTGDTQLQLRTCQAALTHLAEVVQPFPAADQYRAAAQGVALVWTGQVDAGRAVLTAALCPRRVIPPRTNFHDGVGVSGVEHHRLALGVAELFEQRGLYFDRGRRLHEVMSDPPGWGPSTRVCQPCRG